MSGQNTRPILRPLVTGGAGFIGSHLVDALFHQGSDQVVVVDSFFLGSDSNLREAHEEHRDRLTIYREDAADAAAMRRICWDHQPDHVFNLATKALPYSFFNPAGACRVNLDITLTLLELMRESAFERFVHLSSSEVYGSAREVPMTEDHPLLPETTYASGKAAADLAVAAYERMFGLDVITVRPFNNYGPRQNTARFAALVPLTIERILSGNQPILTGDGQQTRDFIYVFDSVSAILQLASCSARGVVVNLGSGVETTIEQVVLCIAEILGWKGGVLHEPARPADVLRHCAGIDYARSLLGPFPMTPVNEGLAKTVEWYQQQRNS